MTVIAFRDGILAADTLVTTCSGTRAAHALKIYRVEKWLVGGAGSYGIVMPVRKWVSEGADLDKPIDFGKIEDSSAMLISPDGEIFHTDTESCFVLPNHAPFAALGSGTDAALAAMIMGASAIKAVNVAKSVDVSCGGPAVWLHLDGTEHLEFHKEIYSIGN